MKGELGPVGTCLCLFHAGAGVAAFVSFFCLSAAPTSHVNHPTQTQPDDRRHQITKIHLLQRKTSCLLRPLCLVLPPAHSS